MRMRKKKNGTERMRSCAEYLLDPSALPALREGRELHIEIGCGKGRFLTETARQNPDVFYVGLERVFDVALITAEKLCAAELPNVRIAVGNAANITELFAPHTVDRIYLNFSDPWPKARHAKRRLTYRGFLDNYKTILREHGQIFFKTDNRPLFDFSLEEFAACGFILSALTYDLHNSEWEQDNIHTEYEDNFSAKGFSINRVEASL